MYREHFYLCGENYADVKIYPVFSSSVSKRKKKAKACSEVQKKLNDKKSLEHLTRLLNTNFTNNDMCLTVTYSPDNLPDTVEEAMRQQQNYIRRIKRWTFKNNIQLKYIAIIEQGKRTKRFHHHIILNGEIPVTVLNKLWSKGYCNVKPLVFNEFGISALARYLVKDPISGKRWTCSHNLIKPKERTRDGKISQRKARSLQNSNGEYIYEEIKKLYPDWNIADVFPFYNDMNHGTYITIHLYKLQC